MTLQIQYAPEDVSGMKEFAQANPALASTQEPENDDEHSRGMLSLQVANGEVQETSRHAGTLSIKASDFIVPDGTLLSTAKTPLGLPATTLKDTTLVTYHGMDIDLRTAETMGLVKKVNGEYVEVEGANAAPIETDTEDGPQSDSDTEAYISEEFENTLGSLASSIPMQVLDATINSVITTGGEGLNINEIAANNGLNTEQLQGQLHMIELGFREQANKVLQAAGVDDIDGFVEWAEKHQLERFQDVQRNHVYMRNTQGYKELAKEYLRSTFPVELPKGMESKQVGGKRLVNHPQYGWVEDKVLARMGEL